MKPRFVFLILISILASSLCLCLRNTNAETLDSAGGLVSEPSDLPFQTGFDNYASFYTWFIITFAFLLLPQQFLIQYIGRHEKSPPRFYPFAVF